MDGYITIGTKLDTKDLEAELKRLKKDLSRYEKENETLINQKAKLNLDTKEAEKKLEELNRKIDSNMEKQRALILQRDSIPEYQRQFDSTTYDNLNNQIIALQKEYDKYSNMHKKTLDDINKQESALNDINFKLKENAQAQNLIKEQVRETTAELQNQTMLENISGGLSKIISKVSRWGLALIGVRGAYSLISRAMSTLSQEDENLKNQIQYIQWALAKVVEPLVKWIMDAVYQIMQWINAIWRTLFGADLFKGPKEFASSMKSASNSAKEIRKELAGFDEMNILGDNTTASGGVGGGVTTPEFDTSGIDNFVGKAKEKIKSLTDYVKTSTNDMKIALANPSQFTDAYGQWGMFVQNVVRLVAGINEIATGVVDTIGGLSKIVVGLLTGDMTKVQDGVVQTCQGIVGIVTGVVDTIVGLIGTIVGFIWGIGFSIGEFIANKVILPISEKLRFLGERIRTGVDNIKTKVKTTFENIRDFFQKTITKIVTMFKNIGTKVGDAISKAFKKVINDVIAGVEKILNSPIKAINKLIDAVNELPGVKLSKLETFKLPRLAKGTILNNPGRGVPIGGAIAGESGREAVLPLSDARLLEELGSTIGRYITINLTNVTELDGTTIARKMKNLTNNDNFLRNR